MDAIMISPKGVQSGVTNGTKGHDKISTRQSYDTHIRICLLTSTLGEHILHYNINTTHNIILQ